MKKKLILDFILSLSIFSLSFGRQGEAYHGNYFMKIKPGTRAQAIGSAYLGFSDDSSALFWNPAGLVLLNTHVFQFGGGFLNYEDFQGYFSWTFKTPNTAFGFGAVVTQYQDVKQYDSSGNPAGDLSNLQGYAIGGLSFFLTDFSSMGLSIKSGYQKIDKTTVYAAAGNLGLLLQFLYFQFILGIDNMGVSQNTESPKTQFLNPEFSLGISYTKVNTNGERVLGVSLALNRGIDLPEDENRIGIGTFIRIWNAVSDIEGFLEARKSESNAFFLNLGLEHYDGLSFSGGFSLILMGIQIDYALVFPNKVRKDFSHYVSAKFRF